MLPLLGYTFFDTAQLLIYGNAFLKISRKWIALEGIRRR